ncbi:hypothetical protein LK533_15170 [Sphingomonas sp. PL-96]|uniref:hypothetical protein n=1 Tax=Sphingomonas sp. PL-96 TaxID=2887201 RepID=UPI001E650C5E|nr:hypothetical protein [Sphingomonas sp. PL-96]MCC2978004.1 hypothetical protein [Sphingomonas sp. PL-96]
MAGIGSFFDVLLRSGSCHAADVIPLRNGVELGPLVLQAMQRVPQHPELRAFDVELAAPLRDVITRSPKLSPDSRCLSRIPVCTFLRNQG